MQPNRSAFAHNLTQARKAMGLTQEETAARIFISRQAYASYEEGRAVPSYETLFYLCDVFEIKPEDVRAFLCIVMEEKKCA